jgi:hypothetical protein
LEPARTGADNLAPQELLPSDTVVVELFYRELGMLGSGKSKSIKSPATWRARSYESSIASLAREHGFTSIRSFRVSG